MRSLSLLAGAAVLAFAGAVRADDDVIRLDGKGEDAEVQEARFVAAGGRGFVAGGPRGFVAGGSRGFVAGGYRGGYWGGYRGYGWGGYGYRGYGYWGGYRPWWGVGYYRPYWRGYYGGYYGGGYYGGGYYGGGYGYPMYTDYGYYSGCSTDLTMPAPTYNLAPQVVPTQPGAPAAPSDGTFPYDGGPTRSLMPRQTAPRDTRMVTLTSPEYQFLAFGETAPAQLERTVAATTVAATVPVSLTFAAFGDDGVPTGGFSGGTNLYARK